MGKYSRVVPKKKHPIRNTILIILLILFLLVAAVVGFLWSKLDLIQFADEVDNSGHYTEPAGESADAAETEAVEEIVDISGLDQVETAPAVPDTEVMVQENVINILIIGTDERTKNFSTDARSDSMILVSIDKRGNTVKLVSLERGMGVPVLEGQYEGQYDWLTHIFRYGGADLLMKTVEHCFKVEVDHYVRFNFTSVTSVVDAIGGIDVELTSAEAARLSGGLEQGRTLVSGMNRLDGSLVLSYARLRSIDSDWQRVQRQRKVILAVVQALKGSNFLQLNELLNEVLPLVQTNMTKLEIADLMLYAPNLLNATFDQMTIPQSGTYGGMKGMGGRSLYAVDFETNSQILREFLYGES